MNKIIERQNSPEAIQLLKASIAAYGRAKFWEIRITYILVLLAIAYPIFYTFSDDENLKLVLFGSSFILNVLVQFFYTFFKENTFKGALFKEKFDVVVFNIPEKTLVKQVDLGEISKYSLLYKGKELSNWYSIKLSGNIPHKVAIAVLQHSNSNWDIELRKAYQAWLKTFLVIYSLLLFAFFVILKVDGRTIFSVGFSILAFYIHFFSLIRGQSSVIEKRNLIISKLDTLIRNKSDISIEEIRLFQDEIFLARQEAAKIPDFFFNWYRNKMNQQVEDYIRTINLLYKEN